MKKHLLFLCALALVFASCSMKKDKGDMMSSSMQKMLPAPTDSAKAETSTAPFSTAAASINASNLYQYFGRDDVLYIDLRDFGDYQQKHLRNFECIPYFAYIFNAEAHKKPELIQLYGGTVTEPVATYQESDDLLQVLFPKNKTIFLMCQSGGRVAQLMTLLNAKGYDMSKIYNVGGMGQFTAPEYADYTVDALEFKVNATYAIEGLTRN